MPEWEGLPGETRIDISHLKVNGIGTHSQLNLVEAKNILKVKSKYFGRSDHTDYKRALLTELNVPLALRPSDRTPAARTAMMMANITAYSTAVGPSSVTKKRLTFETISFIVNSLPAGKPRS
jgi:hypothetical protein